MDVLCPLGHEDNLVRGKHSGLVCVLAASPTQGLRAGVTEEHLSIGLRTERQDIMDNKGRRDGQVMGSVTTHIYTI